MIMTFVFNGWNMGANSLRLGHQSQRRMSLTFFFIQYCTLIQEQLGTRSTKLCSNIFILVANI